MYLVNENSIIIMSFKFNESFMLPIRNFAIGNDEIDDFIIPGESYYIKHNDSDTLKVKQDLKKFIKEKRALGPYYKLNCPGYSILISGPNTNGDESYVQYIHNQASVKRHRDKMFNVIFNNHDRQTYIDEFNKKAISYLKSEEVKDYIQKATKFRRERMIYNYKTKGSPKITFCLEYDEFIVDNNKVHKKHYQFNNNIPIKDNTYGMDRMLTDFEYILDSDLFFTYHTDFNNHEQKEAIKFIVNMLRKRWTEKKIEVSIVEHLGESHNTSKEGLEVDQYEDYVGGNARFLKYTATDEQGYREYLIISTSRYVEEFGNGIIKMTLTNSDIYGKTDCWTSYKNEYLWYAEHNFNPKIEITLHKLTRNLELLLCDMYYLPIRELDLFNGCRIFIDTSSENIGDSDTIPIPKYELLAGMNRLYMAYEYTKMDPYKNFLRVDRDLDKMRDETLIKEFFEEFFRRETEIKID